jgi:histidine triad (HIT) family protein
MDCLFCKIIEGKIPCQKIAESKSFIALLDIAPSAVGHTLIVPKHHCTNLMDFPEYSAGELIEFTQQVAAKVLPAVNAEGFNFILNNGESAGQTVFHAHFHILPRRKDDGLRTSFGPHVKLSNEELDAMAAKIKGE